MTLLIPDLNNTLKEIKESGVRFEEANKRVNFGQPWENEKSLFELESRIQEIGKYPRNKQHEENLIMSGFALHGIVVTVIYCYVLRPFGLSLIFAPYKNSEAVHPKTQVPVLTRVLA